MALELRRSSELSVQPQAHFRRFASSLSSQSSNLRRKRLNSRPRSLGPRFLFENRSYRNRGQTNVPINSPLPRFDLRLPLPDGWPTLSPDFGEGWGIKAADCTLSSPDKVLVRC